MASAPKKIISLVMTGSQPPKSIERGVASVGALLVCQRQGGPQIGNAHERVVKRRRHYSNYRVRLSSDRDISPNDFWIAAKSALPQPLAEYGNMRCARAILVGRKCASKNRSGAQGIGIVPAYSSALDQFGRAVAGKIEIPACQ